MSQCISLSDSDFFISGSKKKMALKAIKDKASDKGVCFSWVDNSDLLECKTLEEAMSVFRWPITLFEDLESGDINAIWFEGEKSGSEDSLFTLLAPFVRHGSWIEIKSEYGDFWRSYFINGEHFKVTPTITWDIDI